MSGSFSSVKNNFATGNSLIDGILAPKSWNETTVHYSVPRFANEYGFNYGGGEHQGFFPTTNAMGAVIDFALNADVGSSANDGFSVEGFTNMNVEYTTFQSATIRVAQTTLDPHNFKTAWGYFPDTNANAGDVWFTNVSFDFSAPVSGNYANLQMLHELGHALGLEHSHQNGTFGAVASNFDAMEFTVMSYRSYIGASVSGGGYTNEAFGYAQSYMMLDIQALQYLYGADFTTNAGNTTYSWNPDNGNTMVNGVAAISPGANRIFATIWDGGGTDTYDLSAYSSDLVIDLSPGGHSLFSTIQQAALGNSNFARGNIYNALQHNGDARSLIENAKGGSGDDLLHGNGAANDLRGLGGADKLLGVNGKDFLKGGGGKDILRGGGQNDTLRGDKGGDKLFGDKGKDKMFGGGGNDKMIGGAGKDIMTGNAGSDTFRFLKAGDSGTGSNSDVVKDFNRGVDKIDLSAVTATPFTFGNSFSGTGPSITTNKNANKMFVLIDVNGDAIVDMRIILEGVNNLSASDFIL